jgi:hypothetical protein
MDPQQIRNMIREEIQRSAQTTGAPYVAPHLHDGVSNLRIDQKDIVPNNQFAAAIQFTTSELFVLDGLTAFTQMSFYGFAANNAGGGAATQRAVVSGQVVFGLGTYLTQLLPLKGSEINMAQGSSSMFTNETGPAFRVGRSSEHFAYVTDGTTDVATAKVIRYDSGSITIRVDLASGWQLNGTYLIT